MANMCDNILELHCTTIPSWLKVDPETPHGISIDFEPRFLFLYNSFDELMQNEGLHWQEADGTHQFRIGFETKWAPPLDLYQFLSDDENTISFMARYFEPGCQVLGYFSSDEGQVDEDCPNIHYSEVLDLDVMKDEPSDNYIEMNGTDSWILYSDYLKKIREKIHSDPDNQKNRDACTQERREIKEYFK